MKLVYLILREVFYKKRMQEQRAELEQLVDERRKLLAIQDQLQRLHDQLPGVIILTLIELVLFQLIDTKVKLSK